MRHELPHIDTTVQKRGNRKGKLPPVGNTVNVAEATWSNSIGDAQLTTVWRDPDFNSADQAFYYVRVLEIPTPRWTAYDAKRFGVTMGKRGADDNPGARLYLTNLVHALTSSQLKRRQV